MAADINSAPCYYGPIEPGMRFIWGPLKREEFRRVEVIDVRRDAGRVAVLCTRDRRCWWVDEARFRSNVILDRREIPF